MREVSPSKQTQTANKIPNAENRIHYLVSPSEPRDVVHASRGSLTFRNRYLVRHQMIRAFRRLHP